VSPSFFPLFFFSLEGFSTKRLRGKKHLSSLGFRHALYHPRERARPLSGTSTPTKASPRRFPIYVPVARGGASLFGGGGGSAASGAPANDPAIEVAPSGFLPPPDIPPYARAPPPPRGEKGRDKEAVLSEVAQAEADRMMVQIEREAARPPSAPSGAAAAAAAGGGEGLSPFSFDAQRLEGALADQRAAAGRRARALRAAEEAASESDACDAAAKRAQAAAREMGSGAEALPDRERSRLEGVKSRLERGRERAEDAIMALKTAEDASAAAEAQKADAVAVAR